MATMKEELRKIRDEKEANLRSADALVIGTARNIAEHHREGRHPGQFLLDLLVSAVDAQMRAQSEAVDACVAVVEAKDEEKAWRGRPQPHCGASVHGTQNSCTRDAGHDGAHRCYAGDVDARHRGEAVP